jgi:4-azaleucine resistance transporter AzlC
MRATRTPAGREFAAGITAVLPVLIGVVPFGIIYGVLARGAGMSPVMAQGMSLLVFAGAAQFLAVQLIHGGAPWAVLLLTTAIINSRHMLYGASLGPYLKPLRPAWKWTLAYLLVDEVYALGISRYQRMGAATDAHWYALGAGLTLWSVWQTSTAVGVFLGAQIPAAWGLDFALPLTFIGLLAAILSDRAAVASAIAAGTVALLAAGAPLKLGLVLAAVVGIAAGLITSRIAGTR